MIPKNKYLADGTNIRINTISDGNDCLIRNCQSQWTVCGVKFSFMRHCNAIRINTIRRKSFISNLWFMKTVYDSALYCFTIQG